MKNMKLTLTALIASATLVSCSAVDGKREVSELQAAPKAPRAYVAAPGQNLASNENLLMRVDTASAARTSAPATGAQIAARP